jgi:UDP:flavonoid glycosyltransferase YjiC (YdhE family)
MISRFDECWIPDYEESPGLSGDLSHKYPLPKNAKFIGPLSRFILPEPFSEKDTANSKIMVIISGPEPQRGIFEDLLTRQLLELNHPGTILSGKPESENHSTFIGKLTILSHLPTDEMNSLLKSSSLVICRSGYSSIMDLHALGLKALFIPTPGQTEQIYLAELHQKSGSAKWRKQETLNLKADIEEALKYSGFNNDIVRLSLNGVIADLKKK